MAIRITQNGEDFCTVVEQVSKKPLTNKSSNAEKLLEAIGGSYASKDDQRLLGNVCCGEKMSMKTKKWVICQICKKKTLKIL